MAQRGGLSVSVGIPAAGAGMSGIAAGGTGGSSHDGSVAVPQGVGCIARIAVSAAAAGISGIAAGGTGGGRDHAGVVMPERRDGLAGAA